LLIWIADELMKKPAEHRVLLPLYFAFTYLLLLYINFGTMDFASASSLGWQGMLFAVNAYLSYNLMYLAPALLLTWLAGHAKLWSQPPRAVRARLVSAVVSTGLTTLFFHANAKLFTLYGMFVNGFVVNLIVTPGGLESLGGSEATNIGFALIGMGFLLGHALLMLGLHYLLRKMSHAHINWRKFGKVVLLGFLISTISDRAVYAYADAYGKSDLMMVTQGVPYYVAFTSRTFLRKLGFNPIFQHKGVRFKGEMHYPARPLQFQRPAKPYNIVWLVSESWRADMLNPEIMPRTMAFADRAQNFKLHYSGGNGTRIGVFTMMTGVPGNFWEPFLQAHRSAPIIDVLQQQNYQMALYSSAHFSYPEFDQTIFSKLPKAQLHEVEGNGAGWEKDRKNVTDMLQFIDQRDQTRPFFTWMFFESPHARYYFPPESVIRKPYRDDINYAMLDKSELKDDIGLIKNRYVNAVHHLDSQFARVVDHLKAQNLLDSTIVVMVGDHGEEFMEHGFWGHNSTFSDPQTRTPLVLWVPGTTAAIHDKLTSHLDIPATLMPLLGVSNPVEDYSIGLNLLGTAEHENVLMSDWSRVGYRDYSVKITLPVNVQGGVGKMVTGPDDEMLSADQVRQRFQAEQPHLVRMMQDLGRFNKVKPRV
jgi:membrane-anchored protein YejM (alkaline phosphatase superfamily)